MSHISDSLSVYITCRFREKGPLLEGLQISEGVTPCFSSDTRGGGGIVGHLCACGTEMPGLAASAIFWSPNETRQPLKVDLWGVSGPELTS